MNDVEGEEFIDLEIGNKKSKKGEKLKPKGKSSSKSKLFLEENDGMEGCEEKVFEFLFDNILLVAKFLLDFFCTAMCLDGKFQTGPSFSHSQERAYEIVKLLLTVFLVVVFSILLLGASITGIVLMFYFEVSISWCVTVIVLSSVLYVLLVLASSLYFTLRILFSRKKMKEVKRKRLVGEIQKMLSDDFQKCLRNNEDSFVEMFDSEKE